MKLQTRFSPGDFVDIDLKDHGKLQNGEVVRVIVGEFTVSYDVAFKIDVHHGEDIDPKFIQLHDIDGDFVRPAAKESLLPTLGEMLKPQ